MRARRRSWNSGWLATALAVLAVQWPIVFAQPDSAAKTRPLPPAEDRREGGLAPAVPFVLRQRPEPGEQALKKILEERRESFRTLMISELHFCRSACGLTEEQSQTIATRAGAAIDEAVANAAGLYLKIAKRGGIQLASEPAPPNPVKLVREILGKLVIEYGSPVQQARYQAEDEKRAAHRRQTAIDALVARLDRMLILSSGQRERLLKMFESNWDAEWGVIISVLEDDDGPLPAIPDRLVVPCLSATQQKVWQKHEKMAIDATEAYVRAVVEIMEGLPSDFTASLLAADRKRALPPATEVKKADAVQRTQ
jgi:hypothetical protein